MNTPCRLWTALLAAALPFLAQSPTRAVPLYQFQRLSDLGYGGEARAVSVAQLPSGPRATVVGVVGVVWDDTDIVHAVLWTQRRNGDWRMLRLRDIGFGSAAHALALVRTPAGPRIAVGGCVEDAQGQQHAALWLLRPMSGFVDEYVEDGMESLAVHPQPSWGLSFMAGEPDRPVLLGAMRNPTGGMSAAFYTANVGGGLLGFALPGLGGESAYAVSGTRLLDGRLRVVGNAADTDGKVVGCEWTGSPAEGFVLSELPPPGGGGAVFQVMRADPLLRYVVGSQAPPAGGQLPAAWSTKPRTTGPWMALPFLPDPDWFVRAPNSTGRAVGAIQGGAQGPRAFTQLIQTPLGEQRGIPLDELFRLPAQGVRARTALCIAQDGSIGGEAAIPGDPSGRLRPYVLRPTGTLVPDSMALDAGFSLSDDFVDLGYGDTGTHEVGHWAGVFWPDERRVELAPSPGDEEVVLSGSIVWEDANGPWDMEAGILPHMEFSILCSGAGSNKGRTEVSAYLWNVETQLTDLLVSSVVRSGKDQVVRIHIPDASRYLDPETGVLRFWLRFGGPCRINQISARFE